MIAVPGFPAYEVDRMGGVFNRNTGRKMKQELTRNGYNRVTLSRDGKTHKFLTHRLIASIFLPNHESLPVVNHIDGVKTNNRVENLEWCSWAHNNQHAVTVLKRPSAEGELHYRAKYTDAQVIDMRRARAAGESCRSIARRMGGCHQHVSDITRSAKRKAAV